MTTGQLAEFRKEARMTQAEVAEALGVQTRTISAWESSDRTLTRFEMQGIRDLFVPRILEPHLKDMCEQVFQAIASEMVSLWVVQEHECILLSEGSRKHDLDRDSSMDISSPVCMIPLVMESLTTHPLRSGKTLNLAGEAITNHPAKKYKASRGGHQFRDGRCESVLHVPAFTESARGPQPVLLLSLENKLDQHHKVVVAADGVTKIYTHDDESTARSFADQFRDELLRFMESLGMLGDY